MDRASEIAKGTFSQRDWLFVGLCLALGATLRIWSASGELGLDEVWSLNLLERVSSYREIFTLLHHDNNHPLNSLYMYWIGPSASPLSYRAAALCFGFIGLVLVGRIANSLERIEGLFLVPLLSFSYVMILFSSEARGYSSMILCLLVAFFSLQCLTIRQSRLPLFAFWASSFLGFVSHPIFLQAYCGLIAWSMASLVAKAGWKKCLESLVVWHLVPIVAIAIYGYWFLLGIELGGGPQLSHIEIALNALATTAGLYEMSPNDVEAGAAILIGAVFVLTIILIETLKQLQARHSTGLLYLVTVLLIPAFVVCVLDLPVLFVRYFLCSIIFANFVIASFLARTWRTGRVGQFISIFLLLVVLFANLNLTSELLRYGRGQFGPALKFIQSQDPSPSLRISGTPDFRNQKLIAYHSAAISSPAKFTYIESEFPNSLDTPWLIVEGQDYFYSPDISIQSPNGNNYELVRSYPAAALSGIRIYLYRSAKFTSAR